MTEIIGNYRPGCQRADIPDLALAPDSGCARRDARVVEVRDGHRYPNFALRRTLDEDEKGVPKEGCVDGYRRRRLCNAGH